MSDRGPRSASAVRPGNEEVGAVGGGTDAVDGNDKEDGEEDKDEEAENGQRHAKKIQDPKLPSEED